MLHMPQELTQVWIDEAAELPSDAWLDGLSMPPPPRRKVLAVSRRALLLGTGTTFVNDCSFVKFGKMLISTKPTMEMLLAPFRKRVRLDDRRLALPDSNRFRYLTDGD